MDHDAVSFAKALGEHMAPHLLRVRATAFSTHRSDSLDSSAGSVLELPSALAAARVDHGRFSTSKTAGSLRDATQ